MISWIILLGVLLAIMAWEMKKMEDRITDLEGEFNGNNRIIKGIADSNNEDSLYEEAKQIVIKSGKASTALLQRRLRVGYSRSARLIDMLEENGVIGKADGTTTREILQK